jgi:hypothetical protein
MAVSTGDGVTHHGAVANGVLRGLDVAAGGVLIEHGGHGRADGGSLENGLGADRRLDAEPAVGADHLETHLFEKAAVG